MRDTKSFELSITTPSLCYAQPDKFFNSNVLNLTTFVITPVHGYILLFKLYY